MQGKSSSEFIHFIIVLAVLLLTSNGHSNPPGKVAPPEKKVAAEETSFDPEDETGFREIKGADSAHQAAAKQLKTAAPGTPEHKAAQEIQKKADEKVEQVLTKSPTPKNFAAGSDYSLNAGDVPKADERSNESVRLADESGKTSDRVEAYTARSRVRNAKGDHKGAIDDADRVLAVDPGNVDALAGRIKGRYGAGDLLGAREDLARAKKLAPGHKDVVVLDRLLAQRGSNYQVRNDMKDMLGGSSGGEAVPPPAAKTFTDGAGDKAAVAAMPQGGAAAASAVVFKARGLVDAAMKQLNLDPRAALASAKKAAALDPANAKAHLGAALAALRLKEHAAAKDSAGRAIGAAEAQGGNWLAAGGGAWLAQAHKARAMAEEGLGELPQAQADYRRAYELDPASDAGELKRLMAGPNAPAAVQEVVRGSLLRSPAVQVALLALGGLLFAAGVARRRRQTVQPSAAEESTTTPRHG